MMDHLPSCSLVVSMLIPVRSSYHEPVFFWVYAFSLSPEHCQSKYRVVLKKGSHYQESSLNRMKTVVEASVLSIK